MRTGVGHPFTSISSGCPTPSPTEQRRVALIAPRSSPDMRHMEHVSALLCARVLKVPCRRPQPLSVVRVVSVIPLGAVVGFVVLGCAAIFGVFQLVERWLDRH